MAENKIRNEILGTGWAFPVTFSLGNLKLEISRYETNINESIRLLLQTNSGERFLRPDFGSNMQQFFFGKINETIKGEIIDMVKTTLLQNEPRIQVLNVNVEVPDSTNGEILINVLYKVTQTNTRHNYVFPFYINEGTNLPIK